MSQLLNGMILKAGIVAVRSNNYTRGHDPPFATYKLQFNNLSANFGQTLYIYPYSSKSRTLATSSHHFLKQYM